MKKQVIIFIGIFCFLSIGAMEQPVPMAPQYTFIGSDGGQVQIAQDHIKKYAPGLALKFSAGFKETQTGQLILPDLDGAALQNFKTIFEKTIELQQIQEKKADEISKETESALAKAVLPEGQQQQELAMKSNILKEGTAKQEDIRKKTIARLKQELEELPHIGDNFLALFNDVVQWEMPYILEQAFAQFAVENLPISDPQTLASLRNSQFAVRAQLLYLRYHHFDLGVLFRVYDWFIALVGNPAASAEPLNKELLDEISKRLAQFTVENILLILKRFPQLQLILKRSEMAQFAQEIRMQLIKKNTHFFEQLIATQETGSRMIFFQIDSDQIGVLRYDRLAKLLIFKKSSGLVKPCSQIDLASFYVQSIEKVRVIVSGLDKIIFFYPKAGEGFQNRIDVFSMSHGKNLFSHKLDLYGIDDIQIIDENHILITSTAKKNIICDLNKPDGELDILKEFSKFVTYSLVLNPESIFSFQSERSSWSIAEWNPQTFMIEESEKQLKRQKISIKIDKSKNDVQRLIKLDDDMAFWGYANMIVNLKTHEIKQLDLPTDIWDALSTNFFITKKRQRGSQNDFTFQIWDLTKKKFVRKFEDIRSFFKVDKNHVIASYRMAKYISISCQKSLRLMKF